MLRNTTYTYTGCTNWKYKNPSIFHFGGSSLIRQITKKNNKPINEIIQDDTQDIQKQIDLFSQLLNQEQTQETETLQELCNNETNDTGQEVDKPRIMSVRTKHKILNKLFALNNISKKLTFVTLTFQNKVDDKQGVKILNAFLTQSRRVLGNYSYLWVAEQQTKNKVHKDNLHFHIITDRRWNIPYWLKYWQDIQVHHGIVPEKGFATSAFNVQSVNKSQKLFGYVAKYVVKNKSNLKCQLWNCSRSVSNLMTTFNDTEQIMQIMCEGKNNTYVSKESGDTLHFEVREFEYSYFLKVCNFSRYHTYFQSIKIINRYINDFYNSSIQIDTSQFYDQIETALINKHFCWHKNAST